MYEVGSNVLKSHRAERERDVVLRRLRGRSLLRFFRPPCEEERLAGCLEGDGTHMAG